MTSCVLTSSVDGWGLSGVRGAGTGVVLRRFLVVLVRELWSRDRARLELRVLDRRPCGWRDWARVVTPECRADIASLLPRCVRGWE